MEYGTSKRVGGRAAGNGLGKLDPVLRIGVADGGAIFRHIFKIEYPMLSSFFQTAISILRSIPN